jgi:hypothetical protein
VWPEVWVPLCDPLKPLWDGLALESAPVIPLDEGHFGVPLRDGDVADVSAHLGANLQEMFAYAGFVWANAVEAMPWQRGSSEESYVQAIALDSDGADLVEMAIVDGGMLLSLADLEEEVPAAEGGPEGRSDFVPVFSRVEDRLFVVGGQVEDEPIGDVWMRSVHGELGWEEIALFPQGPLGRVESATYSFADRRLWVLDQDATQKWRLLRIQPTTGYTQVVATWNENSPWDWYRLVLDHDGQVLLVATHESSNKHVVARIEVTPYHGYDPIMVSHLDIRTGTIAFPPAVHAVGYTFYLFSDGVHAVELREKLGGSAATLQDLGALF